MVAATKKTLDFRRPDYKLKKDRWNAGLILIGDLLESQEAIEASEEDYFSGRVQVLCLRLVQATLLEQLPGDGPDIRAQVLH